MSISKDIARQYDRFHKVSPDELEDINEFAEWFDALLHGPCYVEEFDGELRLIEIKQLVAKVKSLNPSGSGLAFCF